MVYNSNSTIHEILLERRDGDADADDDDDDEDKDEHDDCGGGGVRTRPAFAARIGCRFVLVVDLPLLAFFRHSCSSSLPVVVTLPSLLLKLGCQQESNIHMTHTFIYQKKLQ